MTNVPVPTLGATGFVAPSEAAILAGTLADLTAAFGGGLNQGLTTPQGQLASTLAAIIGDCNTQFLQLASQVDPRYAQGRMQDAIGQLYGLTRLPATSTTVSALCIGAAGTVIPAGVPVAKDAIGNLYSTSGGTIPVGGSITLTFANTVAGPTAFVGPLTIYQTTPGWDLIGTSTFLGLGQALESQQAFEARRQASVGVNSSGNISAIRAAVLASGSTLTPAQTPTDSYVVENYSNAVETIGGLSVPPNSIYVAVVGGNLAAIAQALWAKKDVGCGYACSAYFTASILAGVLTVTAVSSGLLAVGQTIEGNGIPTGITITSQLTGASGGVGTYQLSSTAAGTVLSQAMDSATVIYVPDTSFPAPQPTYRVAFTVPVTLPINILVTLAAGSNPPANALSLLQDPSLGLVMAITGADGGNPAHIGANVYGSRFYQTINQILPGVPIVSVQVGSGTPNQNVQALNANQFPSIGTITLGFA